MLMMIEIQLLVKVFILTMFISMYIDSILHWFMEEGEDQMMEKVLRFVDLNLNSNLERVKLINSCWLPIFYLYFQQKQFLKWLNFVKLILGTLNENNYSLFHFFTGVFGSAAFTIRSFISYNSLNTFIYFYWKLIKSYFVLSICSLFCITWYYVSLFSLLIIFLIIFSKNLFSAPI